MTSGGSTTFNGTAAFNSGAGESATITAGTSVTLSGFTYNATGDCNITGTTGSVTLGGAGDTFYVGNLSACGAVNVTSGTTETLAAGDLFDVGSNFSCGPVTLTAGTTLTDSATGAFNFHPLATSLTILASTNITLGILTYDAPGNCSLTATNGTITLSGTASFQNGFVATTGGLIMQAGTNIAINGPLSYNSGAGDADIARLKRHNDHRQHYDRGRRKHQLHFRRTLNADR